MCSDNECRSSRTRTISPGGHRKAVSEPRRCKNGAPKTTTILDLLAGCPAAELREAMTLLERFLALPREKRQALLLAIMGGDV